MSTVDSDQPIPETEMNSKLPYLLSRLDIEPTLTEAQKRAALDTKVDCDGTNLTFNGVVDVRFKLSVVMHFEKKCRVSYEGNAKSEAHFIIGATIGECFAIAAMLREIID